jgi:hypothetical protein
MGKDWCKMDFELEHRGINGSVIELQFLARMSYESVWDLNWSNAYVSLKLSVTGISIERSNNGTNTLKRAIVLKREVLFLA